MKALGISLVNEQPLVAAAPTRLSAESTNPQQGIDQAKQPSALSSAQFVHGTVRSGQQVYAEGRSLVVLGGVNEGAEIMADGDIHVYGRLQGRAVAGLSGDRSAKVLANVGVANPTSGRNLT